MPPTPYMYTGKKYFLGVFAVSSETGELSNSCEYGDILDFRFFILNVILWKLYIMHPNPAHLPVPLYLPLTPVVGH